MKGDFILFEKGNDAFIVNELIGKSVTDLIVEGDVYIPESLSGIEKIIYTSGKAKINKVSALNDKIAVYGQLNYNFIYRGNDESGATQATNGKIDFMEEIPMSGATEGMAANVIANIDYIDSKIISDKRALLKAVVNIDTEAIDKRSIEYISDFGSDESVQTMTNNVSYTDIVSKQETQIPMSENIVLDPNMNEIQNILKIDSSCKISEVDVMNERILIEGICELGVLYTENNSFNTLNYLTKEFPFTHYMEIKNADDSMMKNINANILNVDCVVSKDDNDERKILSFDVEVNVTAELYSKFSKSIITDAYSTTNDIEIESSNISLSSIIDFVELKDDFEKSIDVEEATVKEVYYYDATPKISEKSIYEDKVVVDGFVDLNVIFLNGDNNKVDSVSSSIPFTTSVDLSGYDNISDVDVKVSLDELGAYRKGLNTILVEAKLISKSSIKDDKEVFVINDIVMGEKLNKKNTPSIVFRVVQPNENIWDIAKNYNVSIDYLKKLNNIDTNAELVAGSKIIITRQV
jgi:LysM repeat protein